MQAGTINLPTYDENDQLCRTVIKEVLFCPDVAVNLISVTRLCDRGFVLTGDANCMRLVHPNGEKVIAVRTPHSMDLWSARVSSNTPLSLPLSTPVTQSNSADVMNASADLLHQRLGHLHSSALRRFCSPHQLSKTCTSCILVKSHQKPFSSSLPNSSRLVFGVF